MALFARPFRLGSYGLVWTTAGLPNQIDGFLQNRVGGGDDSRVGLIATLRDEHVDEVVRNVHV